MRVADYYRGLTEASGSAWNRFWFAPGDPLPLAMVRIATGILALYYLLSFTPDLIQWFGPEGLLPVDVTRQLTGAASGRTVFHFSLLYDLDRNWLLWSFHAVAVAAAAAMTVGLFTRVSSLLSLFLVLNYVHRAPMITGPLEPVLCFVLLYLCIGPSGAVLSLDARRRGPVDGVPASGWATFSLRLIQVHLAALCLMMGLNKLGGVVWWQGEAFWLLVARPETGLWNFGPLGQSVYFVNFWTHVTVAVELLFAVLIWNRWSRPLMLGAAAVVWFVLAIATGQLAFYTMLLVASLSFVTATVWRSWIGDAEPASPAADEQVEPA